MGVCNVLLTGCEATLESLCFSDFKNNGRVGDFQVATGGGFWVATWDLTKEEKNQYEEYARNSLIKQKRIIIRMTERDLKKIQAKAIEEGLSYQSLISMLIHKYNEGKVSIKEWHSNCIRPIADKPGSGC